MNCLVPTVAAPLSAVARAAAFAVLAIAAIGAVQLWQHRTPADLAPPTAIPIDATQPLVLAPSAVDMWRL